MKLSLESHPLEQIETEALAVLGFEEDGDQFGPGAGLIDGIVRGAIQELYAAGEFSGKRYESALLHRPAGLKARRLLVFGAGKEASFSGVEFRRVWSAAARLLRDRGIREFVAVLDPGSRAEKVAAAAEAVILGDYRPDQYKTGRENGGKPLESVRLAAPEGEGELEEALRRGQVIAEAQNFTRSLASEPSNQLGPQKLAEHARRMAEEQKLECEVLDQDRMRQLGMGALLGVAQGSAEPPVLIVLRYRPERPASEAHLGLVGKGVTFDSGGISIKPSENMDKMKYDMSGGAAVIGAMRAIAQLKPEIAVTALVPAVENMPGSRAQRPGDIVTTLSGKTVEVLNTDAEGRLILADAITYAQRLGCTHLVDAATLTGAVVVALGHVNTGLFANDEALADRIRESARRAGEKLWELPLDEEYKEQLKSGFADLPNIGTRWGGAITAAMFLKEFADPTPWAHLDIAGTAWLEEDKPYSPKAATGVAVRTFVDLALSWPAKA